PQGDSIAFLVMLHVIHEGADQHEAAPADLLEVGRVRGVGQRGGVEARPLILYDVDGLRTGQYGSEAYSSIPIGRQLSPLLAEVPKDLLVILSKIGAE